MNLADGQQNMVEALSTQVMVDIEGRSVRTKFIVLPNAVGNRTLLGTDFLSSVGVVLDVKNACWYFCDNPVHKYPFGEELFTHSSGQVFSNTCQLIEREADQREKLNSMLGSHHSTFEPGGEAEHQRQENLCLEQEKKERKKQKEKRERLKAEGKLLTKPQKQNHARVEAALAVLRQENVEVPQRGERSEEKSESDEDHYSSTESEGDGKVDQTGSFKLRIQKHGEAAENNRNVSRLRSPVICVLGHVNTGKTKILDKIRKHGRPPKVSRNPGSLSGRHRNQRGRM